MQVGSSEAEINHKDKKEKEIKVLSIVHRVRKLGRTIFPSWACSEVRSRKSWFSEEKKKLGPFLIIPLSSFPTCSNEYPLHSFVRDAENRKQCTQLYT